MCPKGLSALDEIRGPRCIDNTCHMCPKGLSALEEIRGHVALIMPESSTTREYFVKRELPVMHDWSVRSE